MHHGLDYSLTNLSWAQLGLVLGSLGQVCLIHIALIWDQKATQGNGKSEREQAQLHWNISSPWSCDICWHSNGQSHTHVTKLRIGEKGKMYSASRERTCKVPWQWVWMQGDMKNCTLVIFTTFLLHTTFTQTFPITPQKAHPTKHLALNPGPYYLCHIWMQLHN